MRAKPLSLVNALGSGSDSREFEENMLSLEGTSKSSPCSSSFLLSRRLFSQLGLNGWEKRSIIHLLNKDEKLLRELKHLDAQVNSFLFEYESCESPVSVLDDVNLPVQNRYYNTFGSF